MYSLLLAAALGQPPVAPTRPPQFDLMDSTPRPVTGKAEPEQACANMKKDVEVLFQRSGYA